MSELAFGWKGDAMVALVSQQYAYADYEEKPDPPHQPLYLEKLLRHLRSDPTITRVLDAGCGDGNFASSLAKAGYEVYGLEMSQSGVQIARRRGVGEFQLGSVYDSLTAPFESVVQFDAVIAIEVAEHLYNPRLFIANVYSALRPGGTLILTTPYWGYGKNIVLALLGRIDRLHTALWDGGHIKHWSRRTLTILVAERGFLPIAFEGCGRLPWLWRGMMLVSRKPSKS